MNKKPNSIDPPASNSKTWIWSIIFVLIAIISIFAVIAQSRNFSVADLTALISEASPLWLAAAFVAMLLFIFFEGAALCVLCRVFGHKTRLRDGYIYSAADIYFSSITPSATGGQPASAYFMIKDGVSGMTATAALLANLCMYSLSILVIGALCFIFRPEQFLAYSTPSKIFIIIGAALQILLTVFILLLLINENLLRRICRGVISLLCKIRIFKNKEKKLARLDEQIEVYRESAGIISQHKSALWRVFLLNFMQRISQISISALVFVGVTHAKLSEAIDLMFLQGYTTIGSNCAPIPGAVGISDYLMLDGFSSLMDEGMAVNLELLSRSLSFYFCVLICGASILIRYLTVKKRGAKNDRIL